MTAETAMEWIVVFAFSGLILFLLIALAICIFEYWKAE